MYCVKKFRPDEDAWLGLAEVILFLDECYMHTFDFLYFNEYTYFCVPHKCVVEYAKLLSLCVFINPRCACAGGLR